MHIIKSQEKKRFALNISSSKHQGQTVEFEKKISVIIYNSCFICLVILYLKHLSKVFDWKTLLKCMEMEEIQASKNIERYSGVTVKSVHTQDRK